MWTINWTVVVGIIAITMGRPALSCAVEFRIETKVYSGDAPTPESESLTLCRDGVIYDFLFPSPGAAQPDARRGEQVAIFKPGAGDKAGRFILLDSKRGVRAELTTDEILGFLADMHEIAADQSDPLVRFAADPKFSESFDAATAELTLSSGVMTYRLKTQPVKDAATMTVYREYCDWYARLGAMTQSRALPPMARLAVNDALSKRNLVAKEVALAIPARRAYQADDISIRAEHSIDWRLSKDDSRLIDSADKQLVELRETTAAEYLGVLLSASADQ